MCSSALAVTEVTRFSFLSVSISFSNISAEDIMLSGSVPDINTIILSFTAKFSNVAFFSSVELLKKFVIFSPKLTLEAIIANMATREKRIT